MKKWDYISMSILFMLSKHSSLSPSEDFQCSTGGLAFCIAICNILSILGCEIQGDNLFKKILTLANLLFFL